MFRRVRQSNPDRRIISLTERRREEAPESAEWSATKRALTSKLERELRVGPSAPIDLVVILAGETDFKMLLDEAAADDPRALLAPLRGHLSANARVIMLGEAPLGRDQRPESAARNVLHYLEAPAATVLASSSALRLRDSWREFAAKVPYALMTTSWAALGGVGFSRLPSYADNLLYFGLVPANFALAYGINKVRRHFNPEHEDPLIPPSDGSFEIPFFENKTMFGAFSVGDFTAAGAIVGVGAAIAFNGLGVIDPKFLLQSAGIGFYFFGVFAAEPVIDLIRTARAQKRGEINGGRVFRFASGDRSQDQITEVDLTEATIYRCEDNLTAATPPADIQI